MLIAKKVWFIIPAAGVGRRFSGPMPKQFMPYKNQFIFIKGLETILNNPLVAGVVLATEVPAAPTALYDDWCSFQQKHQDRLLVTAGADERITSVEAGLSALIAHKVWQVASDDYVLVHDAARPCLSAEDLNTIIMQLDNAQVERKGVMLGRPVSDTLKKVSATQDILGTQDRQGLWQASTPQGASVSQMQQAYVHWRQTHQDVLPTDECQLLALAGVQSVAVQSSSPNPKLTFPDDLPLIFHLLDHREGLLKSKC